MAGLLFVAFAYLCFNLVSGALALFLIGQPEIAGIALPITVDATIWPAVSSPWLAGLLDLGLIALFGLQHSVMARPGFKRWFTRFVPPHLERAVYVFATCPVLLLVMACSVQKERNPVVGVPGNSAHWGSATLASVPEPK